MMMSLVNFTVIKWLYSNCVSDFGKVKVVIRKMIIGISIV